MFNLQLFNSQKYLFYLIRLSLPFIILNVNPRISLPWSFVNMVTSFLLSCLTEIIDTDLAQVRKPNICRSPPVLKWPSIQEQQKRTSLFTLDRFFCLVPWLRKWFRAYGHSIQSLWTPKTSMFLLVMLDNTTSHAGYPSIGLLRNRWSYRGRPTWFLNPAASR